MKAILNFILNAVERPLSVCAVFIATLLVFPFAPGNAQVPDTLKHRLSISPPRDSITPLIQEPNVTLDGDLLVFSTPDETIEGIQWAGGVRVFSASSGELLHVIPNPDPVIGDTFGRAVALSGTRLAVGAPRRLDAPGLRRGIVYVYELAGPTPTVPARILYCPASILYGEFGTSVALSGNQLAVGAPRGAPFDAQHLVGGFVFLYDLSSTSPETPWLSLNAPLQGGRFGQSVALAGQTLVVGADRQFVEDLTAGAVFVYDLADGTPSQVNWVLPNPVPAEGAQFGISVAISGSRVVIGCPGYSSNTGRAYVHDLSATNPVNPVQIIEGPTLGHFGWHVAIEGTRIGIGAPGDPHLGLSGTLAIGRAFVYDIASPAPGTPVAILKPGSAPYVGIINFGSSIAMSGDTIAVADTPLYPPNDCFIYAPAPSTPFSLALMTAGLSGDAAQPDAIPFHDGVPNLLKYAFNLNLSGADHRTMIPGGTAGLPHISRVAGESPVFRIEYLHRLNAGLNYLPQTCTSLEASDWEPVTGTPQRITIDTSWERVIHEIPATEERIFGRVGVELGE
jgi:hypothetical protein